MKRKIKLFDPYVDKKEQFAINKVLQSHNWASGQGNDRVLEFENKLKKYVGSKSCVAVNSGTSALHLAVSLTDIKNKQVIIPSMSFVSTAHAVIYNGGKPIFVDIDPNTLCLDTEQIKKNLTQNTVMILPVHFGGMPANITVIEEICKEHNCVLIEDAAHAIGSTYKNKKIGSHGMATCFSFHPVKNLAMPTGGLIALNDKKYLKHKELLKIKRWCGISNRKNFTYDISDLGWNMYMNEFSAAIGLVQLSRLDKLNKKRKKTAKLYYDNICIENKMPFNTDCSYHLYWLRVKNRDIFMKKMKYAGIETGIHYKPIHQMSFYKNKSSLPLTEKIGKEIVSIPIHPNLSDDDVEFIIKSINNIC
jgi:dTDP-4-amino-4,6-dideoxygalactose transaminase